MSFGLQVSAQTAADRQAVGEAVALPELAVTAAGERGDGPVEGYRATRSTSATRTDTPIRDIFGTVARASAPVPVVDAAGAYQGCISQGRLLSYLGGH